MVPHSGGVSGQTQVMVQLMIPESCLGWVTLGRSRRCARTGEMDRRRNGLGSQLIVTQRSVKGAENLQPTDPNFATGRLCISSNARAVRVASWAGLRVCEEIIWTLWRERRAGRCEAPRRRRCRTSSRSPSFARDGPLPRIAGQARWLCCSLLTYRPGYCSSLAPRQRAWGPEKCPYYFFTDPTTA